jgi:hypothetical protein
MIIDYYMLIGKWRIKKLIKLFFNIFFIIKEHNNLSFDLMIDRHDVMMNEDDEHHLVVQHDHILVLKSFVLVLVVALFDLFDELNQRKSISYKSIIHIIH